MANFGVEMNRFYNSSIIACLLAFFGLVTDSLALSAEPRVTTIRYDERDGLSSRIVGGGVRDSLGLMWFATWNGLNCYDGYEFHPVGIRPGDGATIGTNLIRDILLTGDGNILCHTDNDIYEYDLSTYSFRDVAEEVRDSLMGIVGRKWHGLALPDCIRWDADNTGLYKSFTAVHPARILDGTVGCEVRSILVDRGGRLWVGSRRDRNIRLFDVDGAQVDAIQLTTVPYCIYETRRGTVWVGGKPGALIRLRDRRPEWSAETDGVYDIAEDSQGRLWVATFGGGLRCCPNPDAAVPELSPSLGGRKVRKVLITPDDRLVAATTDGLIVGRIDADDYRRSELRTIRRDGHDAGSLASNSVLSVARDASGTIFVATESSGVDVIGEDELFGPNPVFTHLDARTSTLPGDMSRSMGASTDSAVVLVGPDYVSLLMDGGRMTDTFSRAFWGDSCRFTEASPVWLPDGSLALGAEEGLFVAPAMSLTAGGMETPLVFTTLAVNGDAGEFVLPARAKVMLGADERNISVGYAALDYTDNSGILYRTRLDGSPWSSPGKSRSVTLFNLAPGHHLLEVQSTDRYGRWAPEVRGLEIEVAPYWHETWWALALGIVGLCACIYVIVYVWLYVRRIDRQRRELLEKYTALIAVREEAPVQTADPSDSNEDPEPLTQGQKPEDAAFLNRVRLYISENIGNPDANVDDMAAFAAVSRSTLNRRLKSCLGVSAAQLMIEARMKTACKLLTDGSARSMGEVADMCGYADAQYFQRAFRKRFGVSPADYSREE